MATIGLSEDDARKAVFSWAAGKGRITDVRVVPRTGMAGQWVFTIFGTRGGKKVSTSVAVEQTITVVELNDR